MTSKKPIPCCLCGRPVRHLGAVRWDGSDDPKDGYLTGLHPVCSECLKDPEVREMVTMRGAEVTN
jgi:hypothetical protein